MHRVRYYKINGRIVWDRTNKIDILTGSEQQNQVSNGMSTDKLSLTDETHFFLLHRCWTKCTFCTRIVSF